LWSDFQYTTNDGEAPSPALGSRKDNWRLGRDVLLAGKAHSAVKGYPATILKVWAELPSNILEPPQQDVRVRWLVTPDVSGDSIKGPNKETIAIIHSPKPVHTTVPFIQSAPLTLTPPPPKNTPINFCQGVCDKPLSYLSAPGHQDFPVKYWDQPYTRYHVEVRGKMSMAKDEMYQDAWEWNMMVEGDKGKTMYMTDLMLLKSFRSLHKLKSAFKYVLYNTPRLPTIPTAPCPMTPDNGASSSAAPRPAPSFPGE
jgi:hypothetical protein